MIHAGVFFYCITEFIILRDNVKSGEPTGKGVPGRIMATNATVL